MASLAASYPLAVRRPLPSARGSSLCSAGPPRQQCESLQGHPEAGGAVRPSDAEEDVVAILDTQHQDGIQLAALQAARCGVRGRTGGGTWLLTPSPHRVQILYQQPDGNKLLMRLLIYRLHCLQPCRTWGHAHVLGSCWLTACPHWLPES